MSASESTPSPQMEPAPDTFCIYLAKQLIAQRGFSLGTVPEAEAIAAQSDIVLSLFDGMTSTIVGLIDRETHPGKAFTLTQDEVAAIGKECMKYTGRINGAKMPLTINLMEIGPASDDQHGRLATIKRQGLFSKVIPFAWIIDTDKASIWTTGPSWWGNSLLNFIKRLLDAPRQEVVAPTPVAVAPAGFPWLTAAILLVLAAIFAAEIVFGIGSWQKALQPTVRTLLAFGGLYRNLVFDNGEWYRLFSAPFLHADALHLLMNAISLGLAGYVFENLIGRAWFAAIYAVSAICGSLLSLALNPGTLVSVGASGAVMGLFAAMLIASTRYPPGPTRTSLQMNAIYVLIPSLLPLASVFTGGTVDYAAHFGGAIGGVVMALIARAVWSSDDIRPRLRTAALAVALAGAIGAAYAAVPIRQNYSVYEFTTALTPQAQIPANNADGWAQVAERIKQYPRDPRLRLLYAHVLVRAQDLAGAERELRAGLAEEAAWRPVLTAEFNVQIRTRLATLLAETRRVDEGKIVAVPVCQNQPTGPYRDLLDRQKLCGD